MSNYQNMTCRRCNSEIQPRNPDAPFGKAASSFENCNYHCKKCDTYYSNARDVNNRQMIYGIAHLALPLEVALGIDKILSQSLNKTNRSSKVFKFCSAASEDCATWTVFEWMRRDNLLTKTFGLSGASTPRIWMWGADQNPGLDPVIETLTSILATEFAENALSFTEPDVIVLDENELIFIEVKHGSENDEKESDYKGWRDHLHTRHIARFKSYDLIVASKMYQLMRNWVAWAELAERLKKQFRLINLGSGDEAFRSSADKFASLLSLNDAQKFELWTWGDLLTKTGAIIPQWLHQFLTERAIVAKT